jgi:hypothetical protein
MPAILRLVAQAQMPGPHFFTSQEHLSLVGECDLRQAGLVCR